MRIPVLIQMRHQEPLVESATAALQRRPPTFSILNARTPAGFNLHEGSYAVPLGDSNEELLAASFEPAKAESFAVHGFVEAKSLADVPTQLNGNPVFSDPRIVQFHTCVGSAAVGSTAHVQAQLNVAGLAAKGLDGANVAIAIMDSGINLTRLTAQLGYAPQLDSLNSWSPPRSTIAPGQYPAAHGTMCAYDALIAAPKATLLDIPILSQQAAAGAIVGSTLGVALQGYSSLLTTWAITYAAAAAARYQALVISNSWGMAHPSWDFPVGHPGRYVDNPQHPFNLIVGVMNGTGADILFAAGNCGSQCPSPDCQGRTGASIMGANAHGDVFTIAGCDTNNQRVGYSSQGPSIPNMPQNKPDISTYTHFVGSETSGPGTPDEGTSAACPVAAGCVAALRTKLPPTVVAPAGLFTQFRNTARPAAGQAGWNGDYGYGILDPLAAAAALGL